MVHFILCSQDLPWCLELCRFPALTARLWEPQIPSYALPQHDGSTALRVGYGPKSTQVNITDLTENMSNGERPKCHLVTCQDFDFFSPTLRGSGAKLRQRENFYGSRNKKLLILLFYSSSSLTFLHYGRRW